MSKGYGTAVRVRKESHRKSKNKTTKAQKDHIIYKQRTTGYNAMKNVL